MSILSWLEAPFMAAEADVAGVDADVKKWAASVTTALHEHMSATAIMAAEHKIVVQDLASLKTMYTWLAAVKPEVIAEYTKAKAGLEAMLGIAAAAAPKA
jgi:hypothetical protein